MAGRDLLSEETPVYTSKQQGRDLFADEQPESFNTSLKWAVPRMIFDAAKSAYQGIQNLPERYEQAKTEIPGLYNLMTQPNPQGQTGLQQLGNYAAFGSPIHGGETGRQALAGLAEYGQNLLDLPQNLTNYASKRLNLIPSKMNDYIQSLKLPGAAPAKESIDQYFGEPKEPGQALVRGTFRNINKIIPTSALLSAANPLKLTSSNIMNNVVREGDRQIGIHNRLYNNLWRDADRAGINQVPHDLGLLQRDFDIISQYKTPKEYQSIVDFSRDNSLANGQRALTDLRQMSRKLDEKSRSGSLTSEETNLRNALQSSENHIESNMFRNQNGTINQPLLNRYRNITRSYRENVVPYRYNDTIQNYINSRNQNLIAKKTVDALKNDIDFVGARGHAHPELFRPDQLKTLLKRSALGGTAIGGLGLAGAGLGLLGGLNQPQE